MPYNPGITYNGGEYIARGIESFGQSVAQGIDRYKEQSRKAKSLRSLVEAYNPGQPTAHLSLGELEGAVQAEVIKRADKTRSLAEQMQRDQMDMQRQGLDLRRQEADWHRDPTNPSNQFMGAQTDQMRGSLARATSSEAGMQQFNRGLADQFQRLGEIGLQPNADDVTRLAAQNGMAGDPHVGRLSESMRRFGGEGGEDSNPKPYSYEDDVTGYRQTVLGKQMQYAGINPAKADQTATVMRDENGKVIARGVMGKSGFKSLSDPNKMSHSEIIAGLKIQDPKLKEAFKKHLVTQFPDMADEPIPVEDPGIFTKAWRYTFGGPAAAPASGVANSVNQIPVGGIVKQGGKSYQKTDTGWKEL
jgi:hypothetical protein